MYMPVITSATHMAGTIMVAVGLIRFTMTWTQHGLSLWLIQIQE
jgi:hypothetical protein